MRIRSAIRIAVMAAIAIAASSCETLTDDAGGSGNSSEAAGVYGVERNVTPLPAPDPGSEPRVLRPIAPTTESDFSGDHSPAVQPSTSEPSPTADTAEETTAPVDNQASEPAPAEPRPSSSDALPPSGMWLVADLAGNPTPIVLDGADIVDAFDAQLIVEDNRHIDHVEWLMDGTTFRDDDLDFPYTLRYASVLFPLDRWISSDQDLPGRFRAGSGTAVELTAVVVSDNGTELVTAVFTVGGTDVPAAPTTTAPASSPTTTSVPPAPATGAPWVIPGGVGVSVALPQGQLGPRTATAIDPSTVSGISFGGGVWTMSRDWNDTTDGGYLDFGAAALHSNGHTVLGFRIEVPTGLSTGHLIQGGGEVGYFEVRNPDQNKHASMFRHGMVAHHYIARGVVGDGIKVAEGLAHHHDAYIEMNVRPGGPNDTHYDGAQIFRQGSALFERIVFEWANAGTIANTTGAVFTQDTAALEMRDVLILNPGGTWQPVRLSGSGRHQIDDVQVIGTRQPNNGDPSKLAPTAAVKITNGSAKFTLHNGVDGAADWLID